MLRVLARTIRNSVWPSDFVGRWSDDRFLVILSGCDAPALQAVSERMSRMAASASIEWWGEELSVTAVDWEYQRVAGRHGGNDFAESARSGEEKSGRVRGDAPLPRLSTALDMSRAI